MEKPETTERKMSAADRCSAKLGVIFLKAKQISGYSGKHCNGDSNDDYPYWLFIPWLIGLLVGLRVL